MMIRTSSYGEGKLEFVFVAKEDDGHKFETSFVIEEDDPHFQNMMEAAGYVKISKKEE